MRRLIEWSHLDLGGLQKLIIIARGNESVSEVYSAIHIRNDTFP